MMSNTERTDLHIHTVFSDGQMTPEAIVKKAKQLGFEKIAITDHDGIGGVQSAVNAGREEGIEVIPGIELAAELADGTGLHILGYNIDIKNSRLLEVMEYLESKRYERNLKFIAMLNDMGYDITMEDLKKQQPNSFVGKPVFARLLAAKGYIGNPKDAFKPGFIFESTQAKAIRKEKLSAAQAIQLITEAGGSAVLAHPIQIEGKGVKGTQEFYSNVESIIRELKKYGLEGLECYHPDHDMQQTERFVQIAEKYDLYITRGSDFHGREYTGELKK